jgi:hypothetical protein
LSITLHATTRKPACIGLKLHLDEDRDAFQIVGSFADTETIDPFIAALDTAIDTCSPTLPSLVQLPIEVSYTFGPHKAKRRFTTVSELLRGCYLDQLPRPNHGVSIWMSGTSAAQLYSEWMIGDAGWQFAVKAHVWKLTSAWFENRQMD